jgi:hypothetical protein
MAARVYRSLEVMTFNANVNWRLAMSWINRCKAYI